MQTFKLETLKNRPDFLRLNKGRRFAVPGLVLQMMPRPATAPGPADSIRFGLTVTRKIGNAVTRNRVRRRLRAAAHQVLPVAGRAGHDYVLIARVGTHSRDFAALIQDLEIALAKVHGRKGRERAQ